MLDCQLCDLSKTRRKVVVGRGVLPCRVLFIGEAPGRSEDFLGKPFVGPAGKLLNKAIARAADLAAQAKPPSYYITNTVRCRPIDDDGGNRPPSDDEVFNCSRYLEQTIIDATPREVVFLGRVAYANARKLAPAGIRLDHPAYLLRRGGEASPEYLRFTRDLSEVFSRAKPPPRRLRG